MVFHYIFPRVGMLCQEKSGNPELEAGKKMCVEKFQFFRANKY
jgi:hypothetical protein